MEEIVEFEEQNQFKKELEIKLPEAKTRKDQLEVKADAYGHLISSLRYRLGGYKTLLKELVRLEQKTMEEDDKEAVRLKSIFEITCEFDVFVKEYVRTLNTLEKVAEEREENYRQLCQLRDKEKGE